MAMPRYKYGMGNAPIRFPSAASRDGPSEAATTAAAGPSREPITSAPATSRADINPAPARPPRWSMFGSSTAKGAAAVAGDDTGPMEAKSDKQRTLKHHASVQGLQPATRTAVSAAHADLKRPRTHSFGQEAATKDARTDSAARTRKLSAPKTGAASSPQPSPNPGPRPRSLCAERWEHSGTRVSWFFESALPGTASVARAPTERTSLLRTPEGRSAARTPAGEMAEWQCRQGSPCPSIRSVGSAAAASRLRPSSLFWTDIHADLAAERQEESQAPGASYGAARPNSLGHALDHGGDSARPPSDNDDPYGYRALAGPALLPSFHEQRRAQAEQKKRMARSCTSTPAAASSATRWLALAALVCFAAGSALFFFVL